MSLPTAPRAAAAGRAAPYLAAALIVAADAYLCIRDPQDLDRLLINAMLALSAFATLHMRLLSLASAGFAAIGAYASAILAVKLGLPVYLSIPAAALLCGAVALLIGLPVLRLTDVYLAICTLGFGEIVRVAIILLPGLTGGSTGANLSTGFAYETMKKTTGWTLALSLAALCYLFWAASKAKAGRALRAIRENPEAAETMGIDVVGYKNMAFFASALIAGLAGAFYAHSVGSLDNGDFRFNRAVDILGYAVLGGSGAWFGPILGADSSPRCRSSCATDWARASASSRASRSCRISCPASPCCSSSSSRPGASPPPSRARARAPAEGGERRPRHPRSRPRTLRLRPRRAGGNAPPFAQGAGPIVRRGRGPR